MKYYKRDNFRLCFFNVLVDIVFISFLFFTFLYIHFPGWDISFFGLKLFIKLQYKAYIALFSFWFLIANYVKYYNLRIQDNLGNIFKKSTLQCLLFSVALFSISGIKEENLYTTTETIQLLSILFFYIIISKGTIFFVLHLKIKNRYFLRNGLLIGENKATNQFLKAIVSQSNLINIIKRYSLNNFNRADFLLELNNNDLDLIYLSLNSGFSDEDVEFIINEAQDKFKKVEFIPNNALEFSDNLSVKYYDTFPVLDFSKLALDCNKNQLLKRIFDIIFSLCIIVFIFPIIYLFAGFLIIIESGFPIFYKQKRNGVYGKEFECYKFRTMKPSKDNDVKTTVIGDTRITKIGNILRKTSLDELPQFINVLKGEMSVVGPRPHMLAVDKHYKKIIERYTLRHYVKPGITGLAQVKGYRGEVNTDRDMELRIMADIYYVKNWSFLMDIDIIIKTSYKMFVGDKNAI